jgi:hypothetical protein
VTDPHRDPDEDDIERASAALAAAGLSGWLAEMRGGYYSRVHPELLMVGPLVAETAGWEGAASAFEAFRMKAMRPAA